MVLLVLLVFLLVGIAAALVAHVERVEQVVHGIAEARLVVDSRSSRSRSLPARSSISGRQSSTSLLAAGGGAWPVSRSRTSMRERVLDRRIGAVGDLVELAAVEAVVEHGGEVLRHAVHAARADRLDPRLLDRVEHRARLLAARHQAAVHARDHGRRA